MEESRDRFVEAAEVVVRALSNERFAHLASEVLPTLQSQGPPVTVGGAVSQIPAK